MKTKKNANLFSGFLYWGKMIALAALPVALLIRTDAALTAATQALNLWWQRVLPALFPFYVIVSILFRSGLLQRLQSKTGSTAIPCFLLGMLAGYPTGARLASMLKRPGLIPSSNVCGVMFLSGVVANGMLGDARYFFPLFIAHYGSALLSLLFLTEPKGKASSSFGVPDHPNGEGNLFTDIGEGMLVMLRIGGCITFFYVLANVILGFPPLASHRLLDGILTGITELTTGCNEIACLRLPANLTAGLIAAILSFGGICVFAQVKMVAPETDALSYFISKLCQGCLAGILAYLLTPLFIRETVSAFSPVGEQYWDNALLMAGFLFCTGFGFVLSLLSASIIKSVRAHRPDANGKTV